MRLLHDPRRRKRRKIIAELVEPFERHGGHSQSHGMMSSNMSR